MTALSYQKILQENNTTDPNSITSLTLTHKALSDVSCLGEFKNLERLDLGSNNLTSLEGLKSCTNLKWLSVIQNKLHTLKGIDGLSRLTVLNAGKNKLKSMDEVKSLSSLRALILNDNEISSVCKLDQMKELNTLVLSRNPICSLGESLVKVKSITKLSLSNCQLQKVDSSLRSCLELKELRLAHNEIMTIPNEFGHFVKLQNLDLGNNLISNWSNLKVISSLVDLTNLNLQGNPITEKKENLQKKVKKMLPNLHVFNSRPVDKIVAKGMHEKPFDFAVEADNKLNRQSETQIDQPMRKKELQDDKGTDNAEITNISEKRMKKKVKLQKDTPSKLDIIDSAENPFMDPSVTGASKDHVDVSDKMLDRKRDKAIDGVSAVVTYPTKKKNKRNHALDPAMLELSQVDEIGLGGTSAWDA